jgi:hypothetical protein
MKTHFARISTAVMLYVLLGVAAVRSQTIEWAVAAGSKNTNTKGDMPVSLATDANGNTYLLSHIHEKEIYVGSTALPDGMGLAGSTMTLISSLDKDGNYRWSKVIGGANTEAKEVKVVKNNVYLFGSVYTLPPYKAYYDKDYTTPSDYYSNISLLCYDTSGNFQWVVRPDSIIATMDNSFYRPISFDVDDAGNSYMLVTMPPDSKIIGSSMRIPATAPYVGYGFYVLKYNPTGSLVSVTMLKDFCYTKGTSGGVVDYKFTYNQISNEYYVYGVKVQLPKFDTLYINNAMLRNGMFFTAFGSDGTYKWDIRDDKEIFESVGIQKAQIDASGNIIIGGAGSKGRTFNGYKFENLVLIDGTAAIPFIMKMRPSGSLIWCKTGGCFGGVTQFLGTFGMAMNAKHIAIGGVSGQRVFFGEPKDSIYINSHGQDGWFAVVDINSGKTVKMGAA